IRPATAVVEQDPARKDPAAGGGEGAVVVWQAADPKGRLAWQEAWKESGEGEAFSILPSCPQSLPPENVRTARTCAPPTARASCTPSSCGRSPRPPRAG